MIDGQGPILLDTQCWIWLQSGQLEKFSQGTVEGSGKLRRRACYASRSSREIALLESKGRIRISMDCQEWVRRALETPGLSLVPLTPEIAVESTRLPGNIHADPADRILVATATRPCSTTAASATRASSPPDMWRTLSACRAHTRVDTSFTPI